MNALRAGDRHAAAPLWVQFPHHRRCISAGCPPTEESAVFGGYFILCARPPSCDRSGAGAAPPFEVDGPFFAVSTPDPSANSPPDRREIFT
ncbi:MAG TPA: hypothetical protein IAB39_03670 [Candidatus Onthovicinus excrementipullorum]|nr:hypothetical protein [Candidatus Onthovicinus excrementipullorum]